MPAETFSQSSFDAQAYAALRQKYSERLYSTILEFHDQGDGTRRGWAVDLGCGPGTVTTALAPHFSRVTGVDPSAVMVDAAQSLLPSALADKVEYKTGVAERLEWIGDGEVDIITSGTAAHWFPKEWWGEASRILKPGGTVALWTASGRCLHPSNPHATLFKTMTEELWHGDKIPLAEGNVVAASLYDLLPVPDVGKDGWEEIKRIKWDVQGEISDPEKGFILPWTATLKKMRAATLTYAPVVEWRKANPTLVDTKDDPIHQLMETFKAKTGYDDESVLEGGAAVALILVRKGVKS